MASGTARLRVAAVTLDFGNTLVRVDRASARVVVETTADVLRQHGVVRDREAFLAAWAEERERQFREDVPHLREVDIAQRAARVLARQRGMQPPPADVLWDDAAAARHVDRGEVDAVVDAYSAAFVSGMTAVPDATATLRSLSEAGFALAILSNWPLAFTIDRFAEARGWMQYLRAVVVSQRVGTIKPHPAIFEAAESELGFAGRRAAGAILHVGDDWAADVVGAAQAGWRSAYLRNRQHDTPLPTSRPADDLGAPLAATADLEIDELGDLPGRIELDRAAAAAMVPA